MLVSVNPIRLWQFSNINSLSFTVIFYSTEYIKNIYHCKLEKQNGKRIGFMWMNKNYLIQKLYYYHEIEKA